jgi:hypothetical protein
LGGDPSTPHPLFTIGATIYFYQLLSRLYISID